MCYIFRPIMLHQLPNVYYCQCCIGLIYFYSFFYIRNKIFSVLSKKKRIIPIIIAKSKYHHCSNPNKG